MKNNCKEYSTNYDTDGLCEPIMYPKSKRKPNITTEAFIQFCNNMIIAEESSKNVVFNKLSQKQQQYLLNSLNEKYSNLVKTAFKKIINKYKDLNDVRFDNGFYGFTYNKYDDTFELIVNCFGNYAYENGAQTKTEMKSQTLKYKKDLITFSKDLQNQLPKDNNLKVIMHDNGDGMSLNEMIQLLLNVINKEERAFSNGIEICVEIPFSKCKDLISSESSIKESEQKKYLKIYEEFINFLKKPYKLSGSLWSGMIADICSIMDISSDRLNQIISKNIRPIGTKTRIHGEYFSEPDYGEEVSEEIGDCYILEEFDADLIAYSINKKKLYWVNFEHNDCEIFFENYPMSSREFEDAAYGYDDELKKELQDLFNNYNEKNHIKF